MRGHRDEKRLRKKKHIKEFAEYRVDFELKVKSEISDEEFDKLFDQLVADFVEGNKLYCGGSWDMKQKRGGLFIETGRDLEKAKEILEKLKKWLDGKDIAYDLNATIKDAWYLQRAVK